MSQQRHSTGARHTGGLLALSFGALGVVYGDLGTSPLYSIREAFEEEQHRLPVDTTNVLGAVSIILWTLVILIAIKYVLVVMRADNEGEGGILALTALVDQDIEGAPPGDPEAPDAPAVAAPAPEATTAAGAPADRVLAATAVAGPPDRPDQPGRPEATTSHHRPRRGPTPVLVLLGLFGTALLIGDGMITPAISVLSAIEGTTLIDPGFERFVIPLSVVILIGLFSIQRFGTAKVGNIFGPVMLTWFVVMAVFGIRHLVQEPTVLQAVNPIHAYRYFEANGVKAFLSMGSLFLVVTGGEALYADMGHFGRKPITFGWFGVVMPSLICCYLGIGALLIHDPSAIESPFFMLAPESLRLPTVVLATLATIVASQALIAGVFSLTVQAINLGYAPRTKVVNTSASAAGQIYVPAVNWLLMASCVGLVLAFRSSASLAAAFGLAVTTTMFVTTLLFATFAHKHWRWSTGLVVLAATPILLIEGAFLAANVVKIPRGGWFPLVLGAVVFTLLTTWKTGRTLLGEQVRATRLPLATLAGQLRTSDITRTPGTSVFLYSQPAFVPGSMLTLMRSTQTLPEDCVVVSVLTAESPLVPPARRETSVDHGSGIRSVTLRYGFMEHSRVADDLHTHLEIDPEHTTYVLGREIVRSTERTGMARWREHLFAAMNRNVADVAAWFHLPADRVIDVGSRVEI